MTTRPHIAAPRRRRKPKWRLARARVGMRVIIPDVKGQTFAGFEMQQDPRNVGKVGTIIGFEDCSGVRCPRIRLDGGSRRIVMGYQCWWMPLAEWKKPGRACGMPKAEADGR